MTTYEYLSDLLGVHNLLRDDETLSKLLAVSSGCFNLGDTAIEEFFVYHSTVVEGNTNLKLENLIKAIREFQLTDTILKLNDLFVRLESYINSLEEPTRQPVTPFVTLLGAVTSTYESFIMNPSVTTVYDCMKSLRELNRAQIELLKTLTDLFHFYLPKIEIEGNSQLSISFSSRKTYREFIAKLASIDKLYSELCALAGVSESEYPLTVIRVEYGSLWLRIFGESKVVTLLTSLIESAVSYMHRNFTNEGKIEAIPKKVSAVEEVLKLSEKLDAAGIDTKAINENIQKSAVVISQELNTLLAGEPNITINGETYSVGQDATDKYLKQSFGLYLTSGDEDADDGNQR